MCFGHIGGTRFVAGIHQFEAILYVMQCIQNFEIAFTRYAKGGVGAMYQ